jgi:hypothetical protein
MSDPGKWPVECPVCYGIFSLDLGILILPKHNHRDFPTMDCLGEGQVGTAREART